ALPGFALPGFGGLADGSAGGSAAYSADGGHRGHGVGEPTAAVSAPELGLGDTCHLDVADSFGNLVTATPGGGQQPAAGTAAAAPAVAQPGAARGGAVSGVRYARRRPAGPVDARVLPE